MHVLLVQLGFGWKPKPEKKEHKISEDNNETAFAVLLSQRGNEIKENVKRRQRCLFVESKE